MIKSTGIVRRVDELGRVVLPIELRRTLGIETGDPLEIFVDGRRIILKKYQPGCIYCNQVENLVTFRGLSVCRQCLTELKNL